MAAQLKERYSCGYGRQSACDGDYLQLANTMTTTITTTNTTTATPAAAASTTTTITAIQR